MNIATATKNREAESYSDNMYLPRMLELMAIIKTGATKVIGINCHSIWMGSTGLG
jgi:hypothetical protein